jgi:hypothetical protein
MSSLHVLDGTHRGRWSDTPGTVTSGLTVEDVASSPGLENPALILSPPLLLEYQLLRQAQDRLPYLTIWTSGWNYFAPP